MGFKKEIANLVAKAWSDSQFKEQLLKNPEQAVKENGITVPKGGKQIKICENTENTLYFVIPEKPKGELSEKELESIASGWKCLPCI